MEISSIVAWSSNAAMFEVAIYVPDELDLALCNYLCYFASRQKRKVMIATKELQRFGDLS